MIQVNNTKKFDNMGKLYACHRPAYPQDFIDYLCSEIGLCASSIVADIGSGTGILTKQLLESGAKVYAVEPNDDMRLISEQGLKDYGNFYPVKGTAENTSIYDKSVDFITAAQAFHWFDAQKFKTECNRILKPSGKVILVWNSRDEESPAVQKSDMINKKYCPNFKGFSGGMRGTEDDTNFSGFFTEGYEKKVFSNNIIYDKNGFVGRNLSGSYALKEDDENYLHYVSELDAVFDKYSINGQFVMSNYTQSYVGSVVLSKDMTNV